MELLPTSKARDIILAVAGRPTVELVDLQHALGYNLAQDIVADRDIPCANRSAMDGFAVQADDLANAPVTLDCVGEIAAGTQPAAAVEPGQCIRIFTGANIPRGADTVVMKEDTDDFGESVLFRAAVPRGRNIFRRGENARRGDVLIPSNERLTPERIGICAAVGCAEVAVSMRPRIAVLATGEELLDVTDDVGDHQLRNSNGPTLAAILQKSMFSIVHRDVAADDESTLRHKILECAESADVIITTGGVSVGKYDLVASAIESSGGTIHYHGVAIKPGKPQLFASLAGSKLIFGLPGNPLSSLIGLYEFVLPTLRLLGGCHPEQCRSAWLLPAASVYRSKGKRESHVLSKCVHTEKGLSVAPIEYEGSADLVAAGEADGTAVIPIGTREIAEHTTIEFHPWFV